MDNSYNCGKYWIRFSLIAKMLDLSVENLKRVFDIQKLQDNFNIKKKNFISYQDAV
jgi:hypothetical protein